jgi:hypothetical protein
VGHAAGHDRVQPVRLRWRQRFAPQQRRDRLRIASRQPAEGEREHVVVHRHAIERDGAQQRLQAHGHEASLPGRAQRHDVGIDRVAQEGLGQSLGVQRFDPFGTGGEAQLPAAAP